MTVLFLLIGISLLIALAFLFAFIWSAGSGQYDDDYTPAVRILFENTVQEKEENGPVNSQKSTGSKSKEQ